MEEAQPLLPRNDDVIIKQPASDAGENLSPPNDLSSTNKFIPAIDQHLLEMQKRIVFMHSLFLLRDNSRVVRQHGDLIYY